jgi:hypothetical protein
MKRSWVSISTAVIVVITFFATTIPGTASAYGIIQQPDIADGSWSGGQEIPLVLEGSTYPDWLQVMNTPALQVTTPGQICHPFRGGQYGWVASIRQLTNGQWVKLQTIQGWMGDTEGSYMACTDAQGAGTYALFGYFDESLAPEPQVEVEAVSFSLFSFFDESQSLEAQIDAGGCQYEYWTAYFWYHDDSYDWTPGYSLEVYLGEDASVFPLGMEVTYTILGDYPIEGLEGLPVTASTTSWEDGRIYATFTDFAFDGNFEDLADFNNSILVETGGCSYVIPLTHQTYDEVLD